MLSDSLYYGKACVHSGTLWSHDQGSNSIPSGHPSAMFLHDLSIGPIDPSTLQAAQTDVKARSTFHGNIDRSGREGWRGWAGQRRCVRVWQRREVCCNVSRLLFVDEHVMCKQVNNSARLQRGICLFFPYLPYTEMSIVNSSACCICS